MTLRTYLHNFLTRQEHQTVWVGRGLRLDEHPTPLLFCGRPKHQGGTSRCGAQVARCGGSKRSALRACGAQGYSRKG